MAQSGSEFCALESWAMVDSNIALCGAGEATVGSSFVVVVVDASM